jgi:hypothetical protein
LHGVHPHFFTSPPSPPPPGWRESSARFSDIEIQNSESFVARSAKFSGRLLALGTPIGNTPGPGNYPGLWLSGTVGKTPVTDWSFVSQYKTDKVQTRTWYGIPHSGQQVSFYNGQLYLTSMFAKGVPFLEGKSWVKNVMRGPHVRLKLGNNLYDCTLSPVTDPNERAAVLGREQNKTLNSWHQTRLMVQCCTYFHVQSEGEGI